MQTNLQEIHTSEDCLWRRQVRRWSITGDTANCLEENRKLDLFVRGETKGQMKTVLIVKQAAQDLSPGGTSPQEGAGTKNDSWRSQEGTWRSSSKNSKER